MANFIIFAFNRIIFRIANFIKHWYVTSFKIYFDFLVSFFEKLDRFWALKITYRHLFKPLYQDRSLIGYFLGFVFRAFRLVFGGFFYVVLFIIAVFIFMGWALIPFFAIYQIIKQSPAVEILGLTERFY